MKDLINTTKDILKLSENYSLNQLSKIAIQVGKKAFDKSTQGLVYQPFTKLIKTSYSDLIDNEGEETVGTYEWIFYPSNKNKFIDYSEEEWQNVKPDVDGNVYAADGLTGVIRIISGINPKEKISKKKSIFPLRPNQTIRAIDGLNLSGKPITSLPNGLTILDGDLDLSFTKIKTLPSGLSVEYSLYLDGSQIESLPKDLKVGNSVWLKNTPISKKYTVDQIKKMAPGVKKVFV